MPLSDIVSISIVTESQSVKQAGFGVPLILSANATWPERIRFYADDTAVAVDFAAGTPERLAAAAMFAQNPNPERIAIGRLANKPTQKWTIDLGSAGIQNSTRYRLQITRANGTVENADFTTDASATEAELWAGLAAAVNATGAAATLTAVDTGPGTSLVITADAAGNWHGMAVITPDGQYDSGVYMSIVQDHVDPGAAADLAAIKAVNDEWYAVVNLYNSEAMGTAIANWVEANKKLFACDIQDSATVTAAVGGTDFADDLKDAALARTAPMYHPDNAEMAGAAWLGKCLPFTPGSETWKFKTLATVNVYPITATHQVNLEAKRCNYYYEVAGVNITTQGVVSANEFIDVVRGRDWLEARLSERIFGALASAIKIPYTDRGVAMIEAQVRAVLKEAVANGFLTDDPAPTVSVPKVADAAPADKSARLLRNVRFFGTLAGAIHKLIVQGTISV